ncbi:hypothetical protein [uncultured Hoeflea sp.]|uniref:hypothetical protein n=1 Tax=uncultured Hoeflea sp. TaxID=538666 RepID=UPI002618D860|nr:hypothetical protein [uncultured Hoeflea sp.]
MRRDLIVYRAAVAAASCAVFLAGWIGFAANLAAQTVHELKSPAPIDRIVATDDGVFALAGSRWLRLSDCHAAPGFCLEAAAAPRLPDPAPRDALPDGRIAAAASGDIRSAWYGRPTTRYAHGVLGDAIEGGSLVVVDTSGRSHEHVLLDHQVFEDITPRIADLDGDGRNEVITIRASATGGAGVTIYGLTGGVLALRGEGSENGRANRWLNIAGLMEQDDGGLTIYGVRTPHIGGRLFALEFADGQITEHNDIALDVSNHLIGSRELGLSAIGQFGGRLELVLPSQDRSRLRFPLSGRPDIALPGPIDKAIALIDGRVVTATESGALIVVDPG